MTKKSTRPPLDTIAGAVAAAVQAHPRGLDLTAICAAVGCDARTAGPAIVAGIRGGRIIVARHRPLYLPARPARGRALDFGERTEVAALVTEIAGHVDAIHGAIVDQAEAPGVREMSRRDARALAAEEAASAEAALSYAREGLRNTTSSRTNIRRNMPKKKTDPKNPASLDAQARAVADIVNASPDGITFAALRARLGGDVPDLDGIEHAVQLGAIVAEAMPEYSEGLTYFPAKPRRTLTALDFANPAVVGAWLVDVSARVADLAAIAADMTAPPASRELGPAAARRMAGEARRNLDEALRSARRGLSTCSTSTAASAGQLEADPAEAADGAIELSAWVESLNNCAEDLIAVAMTAPDQEKATEARDWMQELIATFCRTWAPDEAQIAAAQAARARAAGEGPPVIGLDLTDPARPTSRLMPGRPRPKPRG